MVAAGLGALYGHTYVAAQLGKNFPITQLDCTPITGFNQANSFNPTPSYMLGYLVSLLKANVPAVYGNISDAHDSGNSCGFSTPGNPLPDVKNGSECDAYARGEQAYVSKLKTDDTAFVIHSDENDHYAGTRLHQYQPVDRSVIQGFGLQRVPEQHRWRYD